MGLFGQVRSTVIATLPTFFEDDEATTEVTWKLYGGSNYNSTLGYNVETWTEYTLTAIKIEKVEGSKKTKLYPPAGGSMATGDMVFLFKSPDLPTGASGRDLIVDGSITYAVEKILPVFNLITKVEVKGYA